MAIVKRGSSSKLPLLQIVKYAFICEKCKCEESLDIDNSKLIEFVCKKCNGKMKIYENSTKDSSAK